MTAVLMVGGITRFTDNAGAPLSFGNVFTYEAGTLTPATTWTDFTQSTPNANPVILDAGGQAHIWGDGGYHIRWYDQNNVFINEVDDFFLTEASGIPYVVTTGSPNAYIAQPVPPLEGYNIGDAYNIVPNFTNTGASTINFSGLGNKSLVTGSSTPLLAGQLISGNTYLIVYNGTAWVVTNPAESSNLEIYTTTGNANSYILSPSPGLDSYSNSVIYFIKANFTNTGAATLNISALGAIPLQDPYGNAFVGGELVSGEIYSIAIQGTEVLVLNPTPLLASYYMTGGTSSAYTITTAQGIGAYVNGMQTSISVGSFNLANATLQIDNLSPVNLIVAAGQNIPANGIGEFNIYNIEYLNGDWYVLNPNLPISIIMNFNSSIPEGLLPLNGSTFAMTSGGTYNSPTFFRAYDYLWDNLDNSLAPVSGGRGVSSLADWNANKNIQLPKFSDFSPIGVGIIITGAASTGGSATGTPSGTITNPSNTGGTAITTAQMPAHTHEFASIETNSVSFASGALPLPTNYPGDAQYTTSSTGSNDTHDHPIGSSSFAGNPLATLTPVIGVYYYINY